MITNRFPRLVLLALPLAALVTANCARSAAPVPAAPAASAPASTGFNAALVSADAKWLVYADLNVLRESTLGKELIAAAEKGVASSDSPIVPNIPKILATIGSATAYGTNFAESPGAYDGTLVVQGTPDLRKIAEALLLSQTIASPQHVVELTDFGFPAYGIKSGPRAPRPPLPETADEATKKKAAQEAATPYDPNKIEVFIGFPPESIVIVSKSKAQVLKARDLFRGNSASLAKAANSPLKRFVNPSIEGAYLFAATIAPPEKMFPADGPPARILQMTSAGGLSLGEHGLETYGHIELLAASDAMADKLQKILDGLAAVMSMTESNDKFLGEFLNATAVAREKDLVTLNITYPTARLTQMVKTMQQPDEPRGIGRMSQPPTMIIGKLAGEWTGEPTVPPRGGNVWVRGSHVIDSVALDTGSVISLAAARNGAPATRYERVDIAPADGSGAPMSFKTDFMREVYGNNTVRGTKQFEFPGTPGNYKVTVTYAANDPEGKTSYVVSVRDPRPSPLPAPSAPAAPAAPAPKK